MHARPLQPWSLIITAGVCMVLLTLVAGPVASAQTASLDIHPLFAELTLITTRDVSDTVERSAVDLDHDGDISRAEAEAYLGFTIFDPVTPAHYAFTMDGKRAVENVETWEPVGLVGPVTREGPIELWLFIRLAWPANDSAEHVIALEPRQRDDAGSLGPLDMQVTAPDRWHIMTVDGRSIDAAGTQLDGFDLDDGLVMELERIGNESLISDGWLTTLGTLLLVAAIVAGIAVLIWVMLRPGDKGGEGGDGAARSEQEEGAGEGASADATADRGPR